MSKHATLTAREYLRISLDKSGRERSNDEQHDDNERFRAEIGARLVGAPYRDNGSASRYATKARGDFDQLVADLKADRFGADLLHMWESSRGSRRVGEWVTLIELCEERSVGIAVTTHHRTYDPANPRDRRTLLEDAVDSEYESAKLSTRAKRASAANAADGKPHGRIPFGYRRRYDPATRKLVAQEPEPTEAPIAVELFERLAAGHSLRGIAADFEARGIRSRSGIVFSAQALRSMALRPLYAGQRSHAAGKMTQRERHRRATLTDAHWPALVDRKTFLAVQRRLGDPARKTTRGGGARHLLSMIARCDVCGGPLAATYRRGTREYGCRDRGHVRIDADELDAAANDEIVTYLSRPDQVYELVADEGHDEALAAARDEVAAIESELYDLEEQLGGGEISAQLAGKAEQQIRARLADAQDREDALATPSALRELLGSGDDADDVVAHWREAPIAAKRELVRLLAAPAKLGELRVTRSPSPGHGVPVEQRIVWKSLDRTAANRELPALNDRARDRSAHNGIQVIQPAANLRPRHVVVAMGQIAADRVALVYEADGIRKVGCRLDVLVDDATNGSGDRLPLEVSQAATYRLLLLPVCQVRRLPDPVIDEADAVGRPALLDCELLERGGESAPRQFQSPADCWGTTLAFRMSLGVRRD